MYLCILYSQLCVIHSSIKYFMYDVLKPDCNNYVELVYIPVSISCL